MDTLRADTDEWECGSCGAITDGSIVEPGVTYHADYADCRSVRTVETLAEAYRIRTSARRRKYPATAI